MTRSGAGPAPVATGGEAQKTAGCAHTPSSKPTPAQDQDSALAEHAAEIRRIGKRVAADLIEIGKRLTECKRVCGHGNWLPWLDREFGWKEVTAWNFMRVYEMSKSSNFEDLNLPVSSLYLLAAPSTPPEARDEIIERAKAGPVSVAEVEETIAKAKGRQQPAKKPPPVSAEVLQQREAAAERIRALMGGTALRVSQARPTPAKRTSGLPTAAQAAPRGDIGSSSSAEIARLQARIDELQHQNLVQQIKIVALEDEVRTLQAKLADLEKQSIKNSVADTVDTTAAPPPVLDGLDIPGFLDRTGRSAR